LIKDLYIIFRSKKESLIKDICQEYFNKKYHPLIELITLARGMTKYNNEKKDEDFPEFTLLEEYINEFG